MRIQVYSVLEDGTTKSLPRMVNELRIYVVAPAPPRSSPDPGPSERWR